MSNAELIKSVTTAFCDNRADQSVIDKNFAAWHSATCVATTR